MNETEQLTHAIHQLAGWWHPIVWIALGWFLAGGAERLIAAVRGDTRK